MIFFFPHPSFRRRDSLEGGTVRGNRVIMFINNQTSLKSRRKSLRNSATPQEVVLWSRLRNYQTGFKFRRQHSIGSYIIDFYCPEKKLAIEIDGSQHISSEPDLERTKFLNTQGIQVLRFWNNEVNINIDGVVMKIGEILTTPPR